MSKFFSRPKKLRDPFDVELLIRVSMLFDYKGWSKGKDGNFESFCGMLEPLEESHRILILKLSTRFLKINQTDVISGILETFLRIEELLSETIQRVIVLPLKLQKDIGKTKSCDTVFNCFRTPESLNMFGDKVIPCSSMNVVGKKNITSADAFVFVDDFLGSGQTAENAVSELLDLYPIISRERCFIVTVLAQDHGVEYLRTKNIQLITKQTQPKGISESFGDLEVREYTALMEDIERSIGVSKKMRFGFDRSEALASLIRTPNNTFPIFWADKGVRNIAPFPRRD